MNKIFAAVISAFLFYAAAWAGPAIWTVNSRADVLKGDARGVSIDQDGTISLSPRLTEVFKTEQSYIWSSVVDAQGNVYLGTGGDGKVFKVDSDGKGALFADLAEINVTALALGRAGELFAGTSPDGKVYKIDASGRTEVYFAPGEKYVWALAYLPDGSLAVATGDGGKIYRVRAANAAGGSLMFDTSETHVISLATDKQGNLYAGTDSNGLVMRFGADGKPFGLLDSPLREIHELAVGPDGSVYVLALGESASAPTPADGAKPVATPENKTVTVDKPGPATPEPPTKSRYDLTGAKSAVYRILPEGGTDILWTSTTVTAFSIYAHQTGRGVLIGTSDKGRVYNVSNEGRETLVLQTDSNQISTIRTDGRSLLVSSSNQGNLFRFGPDVQAEGTYDSAVLDAKNSAAWGRIWWTSTGAVSIQTRSGNTQTPDETWSAWSAAAANKSGQIASPTARYLQWRATLKGPQAATLSDVSVAFSARNIAPEILSISVLPTNVGLAPNPPVQIDPNIILSGMEPATFGIPTTTVAPRRVYQRGATSLQWTSEDRNGDKLIFDVLYKQVADADFKVLRSGMTENFISIDGQSLADGRYVFKIVARDTPDNPFNLALTGERSTEPIEIDNTAPTVAALGNAAVTGSRARVSFEARDAASYITRAEYSVNGGDWISVYSEDGISDSPIERYNFEVVLEAAGEHSVTLRVFDVNGNSGNARVLVRR